MRKIEINTINFDKTYEFLIYSDDVLEKIISQIEVILLILLLSHFFY